MMKLRRLPLWAALLAIVALAAYSSRVAARPQGTPLPLRIHYSSNLEGELEPCG